MDTLIVLKRPLRRKNPQRESMTTSRRSKVTMPNLLISPISLNRNSSGRLDDPYVMDLEKMQRAQRLASRRSRAIAPIPFIDTIPIEPGVSAGMLHVNDESEISFVRLYEECLDNARDCKDMSEQVWSGRKHYNTPRQVSNVSIVTNYKEKIFKKQQEQEYPVIVSNRTPKVKMELELDYMTRGHK